MSEAHDLETFDKHWDTLVFDKTLAHNPGETIVPLQSDGTQSDGAESELGGLSAGPNLALQIGATIGEGGMGVVRTAFQTNLGREVAVKSLRTEKLAAASIKKVLSEAWITGQLEHPNVVPIYSLGIDEFGAPLIVMKRISGTNWSELLRNPEVVCQRFGVTEAIEWHLVVLIQLCNVVQFAHSRGIIHRDLKPDNVMIGEFGEIYLVDWGIAASLQPDPAGRLRTLSEDSGAAGTPHYMAPEMASNTIRDISERSDVYLLGAVLHEVLTGRPPHDAETVFACMNLAFQSKPHQYSEDVPVELAELCSHAMQRELDDRLESAELFRQALISFRSHRTARQLADGANERLTRLLELLLQPETDDKRHQVIYTLHNECRFAFREALREWPDSEVALRGLDQTALALAQFELRCSDPKAARAALVDVADPPAETLAEISALESLQASKAARTKALAAVGAQFDEKPGQRTRAFNALLLGMAWTAGPIAFEWWMGSERLGLSPLAAVSLFNLALLATLGLVFWWSFESLTATEFNYRISRSTAFIILGQSVIALGAWLTGLSVEDTLLILVFSWFAGASMMAINIDRRIWLPALYYGVGFLALAGGLATWAPIASLTNGLTGLTLAFLWRPRKGYGGRPTGEEASVG